MSAILTFEAVRLAEDDRQPAGAPLDFRLAPGEVHGLSLAESEAMEAVAAVAQGLAAPAAGCVRLNGRDWQTIPVGEGDDLRGGMGRIYSGPAWLANLDLDENIILRLRHHGRRPEEDLRAEADILARRFGLDGLPEQRPAWLAPATLQMGQWIRALLGQPALLILSDPLRHLSAAESAVARTLLRERLRAGAAALWLSPTPPE